MHSTIFAVANIATGEGDLPPPAPYNTKDLLRKTFCEGRYRSRLRRG